MVSARGGGARVARAATLIAATAVAADLPLYTRNPRDFTARAGLVEVTAPRR